MPRIYDSYSNPIDFCRRCFPAETLALVLYGDSGKEANQGPDGRGNCYGYDAEHPAYGDEDYHCHKCKRELRDRDN